MKRKLNGKPVYTVGQPSITIIKSTTTLNQLLIKFFIFTFIFQIFINLTEPLKILPKPCNNALGEQGTCMFVWECIKTEGKHLGTCVDGFLFGSCCSHNDTLNQLDSGSSTPVKPFFSNSISAAYHSEHEYTTANLELANNQVTSSNLTSYVNFNNNPPSENDVYHLHETSNSSPIQTLFSTISSINPTTISLQFVPASSNSIFTTTTSSANHHNNLNHHHHQYNSYLQVDNDDHRRPHTQNHSTNNSNHPHIHHHNYENFLQGGDKLNQLTTSKPASFINFNLTNHLISSNSKPTYKPYQYYSTTILPPIVMNYNPFKPANQTHLINKNQTNINKPINQSSSSSSSSNKPISNTHSTWGSFYKPWSNKPNNGQMWSIQTFTNKPSNNFLQTYRPPLFNIFRPHPSTTSTIVNNDNQLNAQSTSSSLNNNNNLNSFYNNKPTLRPPIIRPTMSSFNNLNNNNNNNLQPFYSTRTTPFLSNTQSLNHQFGVTQSSLISSSTTSTTTEQPFIISPNINANNSLTFHEIQSLNYQNISNTSYLTNDSSSVTVTNVNSLNNKQQPNQSILKNRAFCGTPKLLFPTSKVVGGRSAAFGAFPWQVSVRRTSFFGFSSTHRCGGAILTQNWIITAGHCVEDLLMSQIRIRVGEYDFATNLEPYPYQERSVRRKIVHPGYNFNSYENDLALVELDEPIVFQPHISPICLPEDNVELLGKNATVTGWGRLSEGGILPSVLQEVRVPIVSNEKCRLMFLKAGRNEHIPDVFLCAGFEDGGHDSCQGDSGGPLILKEDGKWVLIGIISWGIGCGEKNLPGVCTRITKFTDWINETMKN